jgi:dolichol kinase
MPKKRTKKKRNTKALRNWAKKGKKQSGGFAFLIAALIAAGISASNAAAVGALAVGAATGAATATGAYVATKALKAVGGSKKRPIMKLQRTRGHRLY